jgi:hypothetical protein
MSETLKPREVEKPFLGRWVRTTFALLLGSPVTFGTVIAVLATADWLAAQIIRSRILDSGATVVASTLLLPLLWIVLGVLARQSDRPVARAELLQHLLDRRVRGGGLPGCLLASVSGVVHWALEANPVAADLICSSTWNTLLLVLTLGVCYCPLMALAPGISVIEASQLSRSASRLNGEWGIVIFIGALALAADALARTTPVAQVVTAAFLVFTGVFNYVAYCDIFERRAEYATQPLAVRLRRAVDAGRP